MIILSNHCKELIHDLLNLRKQPSAEVLTPSIHEYIPLGKTMVRQEEIFVLPQFVVLIGKPPRVLGLSVLDSPDSRRNADRQVHLPQIHRLKGQMRHRLLIMI